MINNFINNINKKGKKLKSQSLFREAIVVLKNDLGNVKIADLLKISSVNVQPKIMVKSKRVAGSAVRIPSPHIDSNKYNFSVKSIVTNANKKIGKVYPYKLSSEIIDSYNKRGASFKKKVYIHKTGLDNRSNLKYS